MWQPVLGTCVVKVAFPKGRKELAVSQLQVRERWWVVGGGCGRGSRAGRQAGRRPDERADRSISSVGNNPAGGRDPPGTKTADLC